MNPPRPVLVTQWSLSLVFLQLMLKPLKPLTKCPLELFVKICFVVAVTSVRWASDLVALCIDPSFLKFFAEYIILRRWPSVEFLPKVVLNFHLIQDVALPIPNPSSPAEQANSRCGTSFAILPKKNTAFQKVCQPLDFIRGSQEKVSFLPVPVTRDCDSSNTLLWASKQACLSLYMFVPTLQGCEPLQLLISEVLICEICKSDLQTSLQSTSFWKTVVRKTVPQALF